MDACRYLELLKMDGTTRLFSDWQLHVAKPVHDAQLRNLFLQVFGHAISEDEWNWKYAHTEFRGSLLTKESGEAIGFFGGMPRLFTYQGQIFHGIQNGDVMVRQSERGVFSKKGAFYQVSSHFIKNFIGPGSAYAFGFGFPNQRAFQLGIQLRLYQKSGQLQELSWNQEESKWHWSWHWSPVNENIESTVDTLWKQMQGSWFNYFLPVRDSNYFTWRYQKRPSTKYQLLLVRQRFTGKPLAILCMRIHETYCHWVDYVGGHTHLGIAIQAAREFSHTQGKPLRALLSDAIAGHFLSAQPEQASIKPTDILIPTNISNNPDEARPWFNRFWLMGGDSDFM